MPFDYEDLASAVSGLPNENMVLRGNAIGADPLPKRSLGDMSGMGQAGIPPWLFAILAASGFRGRGGGASSIKPPSSAPQRERTEIGGLVRSHFGQDNVNPRTRFQEMSPDLLSQRWRRDASTTTQSFPATPISGVPNNQTNLRANSFNDVVEALNAPMDRLANRRVLTPANVTPAEVQNQQAGQSRQDMTRSVDLIRDALGKLPKKD